MYIFGLYLGYHFLDDQNGRVIKSTSAIFNKNVYIKMRLMKLLMQIIIHMGKDIICLKSYRKTYCTAYSYSIDRR